jgi:hypothetical protein
MSIALAASACGQSPAFVQPPASEYTVAPYQLTLGIQDDTIQCATVSQEFVRVIGIHVVLGRLFIPNDFQSANAPTAIISYDLWNRRFRAHPAIIGTAIRLNETDAVIVGVAPKGFEFPKGVAVWLPRRPAASP